MPVRFLADISPYQEHTAIFLASLSYSLTSSVGAVNATLEHGYLFLGLGMPEFLLYLIAPILVFVILALAKIKLKEWRELIIWVIICIALGPFLDIGFRYIFMSFIAIVPLTVLGLARFRRSVFLKAFILVVLVFAFAYVAFSAENPFPYYNLNPSYSYYMPDSFFSNTLPISENYATAQLLTNHAGLFSCNRTVLITSSSFYYLALTSPVPTCTIDNLGEVGTVASTEIAIGQAAATLSQQGKVVYVLWFAVSYSSQPNSWHDFQLIDSSDNVGIFSDHP